MSTIVYLSDDEQEEFEFKCPNCGSNALLLCDAVVRRQPLAQVFCGDGWVDFETDDEEDFEIDEESGMFEGCFYRCEHCGYLPAENGEDFPSDEFLSRWLKENCTPNR